MPSFVRTRWCECVNHPAAEKLCVEIVHTSNISGHMLRSKYNWYAAALACVSHILRKLAHKSWKARHGLLPQYIGRKRIRRSSFLDGMRSLPGGLWCSDGRPYNRRCRSFGFYRTHIQEFATTYLGTSFFFCNNQFSVSPEYHTVQWCQNTPSLNPSLWRLARRQMYS